MAAPEAEAELAVGFFGSRFERATPAEREYLRAMADPARGRRVRRRALARREAVPTSAVAERARAQAAVAVPGPRRPIKKGLIYSGERGQIAFTVPHFGRYLRTQA